MKILLIYPPAKNLINIDIPIVVDKESGSSPPLGLMFVASFVEKNTEYKIEILDAQVEEMEYEDMEKEIEKRRPDVVGIQAMTFTMRDVILTAKVVKKVSQDIKVCLGGPHVNIYPTETINIPEIDFLVLGEGEITFTELVRGIADGSDLSKIKGIVFKKGGEVINTGRRDFIRQLDDLPFPARHLVPYQKYYSSLAKFNPITTMITSRGCPYNCIFCDRPHLGKLFRARSAENIVDEMEACVMMGIQEIYIFDDTFTVNKQRVFKVCDEIVRRKLKVAWTIRARVDTVDQEILTNLKKAGCYRIHYGVESGVPEILKVLKKGTNIKKIEDVFHMTKKMGIITVGYFMFGSPFENKEQMLETIKFAKKINADFAQFSLTTPYPATELYLMGLKNGVLKHDYWKEFAENPMKEFTTPLWEENLSRDELTEILRHAYNSFYMRFGYMLKRIFEVHSFRELKRKARVALSLRRV